MLGRARDIMRDQEEIQNFVCMSEEQRLISLGLDIEANKKKQLYYTRLPSLSVDEAQCLQLLRNELSVLERAKNATMGHLVDNNAAKSDLKSASVEKYHLQRLNGLYEVSKLNTKSALRCKKQLMELEQKEYVVDMTLEAQEEIRDTMAERRSEKRVRFLDQEVEKAASCIEMLCPAPPKDEPAKFDTIDVPPVRLLD